jgi:hypothetical protein
MIMCNLSLPAKEKRFIPEHGFLHNGAGERNRKKLAQFVSSKLPPYYIQSDSGENVNILER